MIRITRTHDEIVAISFNGEDLQSDGGEKWYLPKRLIGDEIVNHLPENTIFQICSPNENHENGWMKIPIYIQKLSENIVLVNYENSDSRDNWSGDTDFKAYMEAKKKVIKERASKFEDIALNLYEDDGNWIHLFFSTKVEAATIHLALIQAEQMIAEIESAVEISFEKKA